MRHFSSYGPLDPKHDFHVNRRTTVEKVAQQLVGDPETGGHFFTLFAPRQAGKTTTLREAAALIRERYGDRFQVGIAILHLVDDLRVWFPSVMRDALGIPIERPESWEALARVFEVGGPLKKPTILILDEFDALPHESLNQAITLFRKLYHYRERYLLHGLALIGVHALLGGLEGSMSPFNVQRSIRIPNLTRDEVRELYDQYQRESQQRIEPAVVDGIYDLMMGQPGMTCWFGEVLTEKYNPAEPTPYDAKVVPEGGYPPITLASFQHAKMMALSVEFNTNIRNLLQKAREQRDFLVQLFYSHNIPFELRNEQLQWLYLNGLIAWELPTSAPGPVCVFASPFVQKNVFAAYADDMMKQRVPTELVAPRDRESLQALLDQFDLHGVLEHYRAYLKAQVQRGAAPWKQQPTRGDARPYEAIGHFNLYAWLYLVSQNRMVISPEFRTRNGTADLVLRAPRGGVRDVIEIKSFSGVEELEEGLEQVARYARSLGLSRAFLMVMVDESGERLLSARASSISSGGITVHIEPVRWGGADPEPQPEGVSVHPPVARGPEKAQKPEKPGKPGKGASSRAPRKRKTAAIRLTIAERLELERLVTPLLTGESLELLWSRMGYALETIPDKNPALVWGVLVQRSETEALLPGLLEIIAHSFPTLRAAPFLVALSERMNEGKLS